MVEEVADQSLFSSQQAVLQPPPMSPEKKPKSGRTVFLFGGIFIVILILTIAAVLFKKQPDQELPTPKPSAIPGTNESIKQQELNRVKAVVESANPENLLIVPPMVDMEVVLY